MGAALDGALERGGLPGELWYIAIADRFPGVSPLEIRDEWDEDMVEEAMHLMSAEGRHHTRHPAGGSRGGSLAGIPELD